MQDYSVLDLPLMRRSGSFHRLTYTIIIFFCQDCRNPKEFPSVLAFFCPMKFRKRRTIFYVGSNIECPDKCKRLADYH